jgi:NTE family protein
MTDKACDIVLEGGGVKGIGLVGALSELDKAGFKSQRVAGTSAGAIVGSLVAAGVPVNRLIEHMRSLDYTKFRDKNFLGQFGWPGEGLSLIFTKGIYRGEYLREWLSAQLTATGVKTFADLRLNEPWAKKLPPERRYKLVVIASDVSRGRLVRLPWDYHVYGLDPDKQPIADAVRASMSIPFFYEPAILNDKFLVDGGLLSNFPVDIFDDAADWPTFGIKLSAKEDAAMTINPVTNPLNYTTAILDTLMSAHDRIHVDDPQVTARTIFVDTTGIKATNFDITAKQQRGLFESGQKYAKKFLAKWDFEAYKKLYLKK